MNSSHWHRSWFDQDYLKLYRHRDPSEAEGFLSTLEHEGMLLPPDAGPCLDLGCGSGRHSHLLAARGYRVLALDWSEDLLREGQNTKAQASGSPWFLRGDLHRMPLKQGAAQVFSLFSSFGYHESDERNRQCWLDYLDLPRPGGRLIFDYLNPHWLRASLVPESERELDGLLIRERRCINETLNMVEKRIRIVHKDGRMRDALERVKLYPPESFLEPALRQGYRLLGHWGSLDGREWAADSQRSILLLERT